MDEPATRHGRSVTEMRQGIPEVIGALGTALESIGVPWMLIGGVAVISRGLPRLTDDVDATLMGAEVDLEQLVDALEQHGIRPRIDGAIDFARQRQVLLLIHTASDIPLDVSLAWLPFETSAIERAERMDLGGVRAPVATVDDLLVYKAIAWRPRDRDDIERLVAAGHPIDVERVQRTVEALAEALEDPDRARIFAELVAKARGQ